MAIADVLFGKRQRTDFASAAPIENFGERDLRGKLDADWDDSDGDGFWTWQGAGGMFGISEPASLRRLHPALESPTVWGDLMLRANTFGSMKMNTCRVINGREVPDAPEDLPPVIRDPFPDYPHLTWGVQMRQRVIACHLWGYSVERVWWHEDAMGRIVPARTYVLDPSGVSVISRDASGMKVLVTKDTSNIVQLRTYKVGGEYPELLWIPLNPMPGYDLGSSAFRVALNAVDLELKTSRFSRYFYQTASTPLIHMDFGEVADDSEDALKTRFNFETTGKNQQRTLMTKGGVKVVTLGQDPERSQMVEARRRSSAEMNKLTDTPGIMSHEYDSGDSYEAARAKTTGYSARSIEPEAVHYQDCLLPLVKPYMRELRFQISDLTRGDIFSRQERLGKNIAAGWMTQNEVREMEGLEPVADPNANVLRVPKSTIRLDLEEEMARQQPGPTETDDSVEDADNGNDRRQRPLSLVS